RASSVSRLLLLWPARLQAAHCGSAAQGTAGVNLAAIQSCTTWASAAMTHCFRPEQRSEDNLRESSFSIHLVCSRNRTQMVKPCCKDPRLLTHLDGPPCIPVSEDLKESLITHSKSS
ncbi:hypothetical protein LEMLEM_LOCUS16461, partial [Lemmus lemmus]